MSYYTRLGTITCILEGIGEQSKGFANYLEVFKVLSDQMFASNIIPPNKDLCFLNAFTKSTKLALLSCRYHTFVLTEEAHAYLIHVHIQTHTHKQGKKRVLLI